KLGHGDVERLTENVLEDRSELREARVLLGRAQKIHVGLDAVSLHEEASEKGDSARNRPTVGVAIVVEQLPLEARDAAGRAPSARPTGGCRLLAGDEDALPQVDLPRPRGGDSRAPGRARGRGRAVPCAQSSYA